jgi:tetratricopeptide (TPR) repeat protein
MSIDAAGQRRYRSHDLVRLYARERADLEDSAAERAAALDRGFGAWLAVAERMAERVPGPCYAVIHGRAPRPPVDVNPNLDALTWFDAERAALVSVIYQACRLGMSELAFDLAGCLEKYFDVRGMYADWRHTNEHVMSVCLAAGNVRGQAVMLRGLIDVLTWNTGALVTDAMAQLHADAVRLLEMFTEVGDERGMSDALAVAAWGLTARGAYDDAVQAATRALLLAGSSGHVGGQARARVALALAQGLNGRVDEAVAHLNAALPLSRQLSTRRYEATVLQFLGMAYREIGDLDASERVLRESLAISRRYHDEYTRALSLLVQARVYLDRGDARAAAAAHASLALGREYNMGHHVADALTILGDIALAAGRHAAAVEYLEEAVRLWRTRGWQSFLAAALNSLGRAYLPTDPDAAHAAWAEAATLSTGIGSERPGDTVDVARRAPSRA